MRRLTPRYWKTGIKIHPRTADVLASIKRGELTYEQIATKHRVHVSTVVKISRLNSIKRRGVMLSYQKQARILDMARRGATTPADIARATGASEGFVRKLCGQHGLLCERHPVTGEWYYPRYVQDVTVWRTPILDNPPPTASERVPVVDDPVQPYESNFGPAVSRYYASKEVNGRLVLR